ncbi:MAG: hypothetical protein LBQ57_11115, partial [Spirochaetales bacterium]|nr:hypothetical protein [Spirochaetales bacterium]
HQAESWIPPFIQEKPVHESLQTHNLIVPQLSKKSNLLRLSQNSNFFGVSHGIIIKVGQTNSF